jgi:hypothetical protein
MNESPDPKAKKEEEGEEDKKGVLSKLQEITPDKEEQIALVGVAVRLGIVIWSGFCLTLAYIDLPGFPKQTFDPTFIASIFTSTLTTFGVQAANKKGSNGVSKEDIEKMMASNKAASGEQVIRVQTPLKISSPDGEIAQVIEAPKEKTPPPADL